MLSGTVISLLITRLTNKKKIMMHRYEEYSWLRGFNLVPSWGARIELNPSRRRLYRLTWLMGWA